MIDTAGENSPKGISGKRLAIGVVACLAVIFSVGFWCARAYSQLNSARQATDEAWRNVARVLDARYRDLEKPIAACVENRHCDPQWGQQWRSAVDRFRTSAVPQSQRLAAGEAEDTLARLPTSAHATLPDELGRLFDQAGRASAELDGVLSKYRDACQRERSLLSTVGVRLLDVMLVFRQPQELSLAQR